MADIFLRLNKHSHVDISLSYLNWSVDKINISEHICYSSGFNIFGTGTAFQLDEPIMPSNVCYM